MNKAVMSGIVAVCVCAASASAVTRKVPSEYPQIQAAIQASQDDDVVVVSPGVYYETINFGGRNIVVTGTDPNDPKVVGYTIINADEDGSAVTFDNGETPAAVLTGFTITGGFGTFSQEFTNEVGVRTFGGAGIYCYYASPTITKNVIARNAGAFDVSGPTDADVLIAFGGGIACYEGSPVITYNIIRANSAWVGGGVLCWFGAPTINNNIIFDNSSYQGGGVLMFGGSLCDNTVVGNDGGLGSAIGVGEGIGGNVFVSFGPEVGYTRVSNNIICQAVSGGGVFYQGAPSTGLFAFNNVWGNMSSDYGTVNPQTNELMYGGQANLTGKNGNISVDPLFLNPFNKDYHLTLESPCINAGDPDYAGAPGQKDIDGEARVYASRIDIGADEYVGYVKPVAFAGFDRHVLEPLQPVTLDGGQSFFYDPCEVTTFQWTQVSGPSVVLSGPDTATPTFTPEAYGAYVFQLVVGDDRYNSEPDEVLVLVAENQPPVANAGADKVWKSPGLAILDGTDSWDPDVIDRLTYQWTQIEGPSVALQDADTAHPSFFVESEGQYAFELVVSDGFAQSGPSRVQGLAVGVTMTVQQIDVRPGQIPVTCYPDVSGTRIVYATSDGTYQWRVACKDMTTGKVETFPGTGINVQPKIDGNLVVWSGGVSLTDNAGPETTSVFARNLATGEQRELRARSDAASFDHPAVSNDKVVWVQHLGLDRNVADRWYNPTYDICGADLRDFDNPAYFTIATGVGRHDLLSSSTPVDAGDVVDICGDLVVWEGDGDIYAADISDLEQIRVFTVCNHPARQYDPALSGRFVVWTDERNDGGDIYGADLSDLENIREFAVAKGPGVQEQPTIDGALVVYVGSGALGGQLRLACLAYGRGVLNTDLPDLYLGTIPVLDGATLVWLTGLYGPAQGVALGFGYSIPDGRIRNLRTGKRYDFIQHAISDANDGDQIVTDPDLYIEKLNFAGKAVTVRSGDPNDPDVVAATVLRSDGDIVTFARREGAGSVLAGLTLDDGDQGIVCSDASPTITRCTIRGSRQAGVRLLGASDPTLAHCRIVGGGAAGVEMSAPAGGGRVLKYSEPVLRNCIIEANRGQGLHDGKPRVTNCTIVENLLEGIDAYAATVTNSIVWRNNRSANGAQIDGRRDTVTYSDIEGGWPGEGNIDGDPLFVALGRWTDPTSAGRVVSPNGSVVWVSGDYHLQSQGWRWNAREGSWVSDEVTSPCIDAGDPASELLDEPLTAPGDPAGPVVNTRINMGAYGGTTEASLAP